MPRDVSSLLLQAEKLGEKEMNALIKKKINSNAVGFWEALPKMNIKTFASLAKKVQVKQSDEKLVKINADRSLFGRLLIPSNTRNIDLRDVLTYELSPVPCALAHTDGTLRKSNKSILLTVLEDSVQVLPRLPCDNGTSTFGKMASHYFNTVTAPLGKNNCSRVDIVFDRYEKVDSIKESERRRGSTSGYEIKIAGPHTAVPKNWNAYISNPKRRLVDPITIAFAEKTRDHALKGAGAWVIRAAKIHKLYKCSVIIVVTRKRETLRHYSLCKYKQLCYFLRAVRKLNSVYLTKN